MRLLVCGGRDFTDALFANAVLDNLRHAYDIEVLIHGAARGADTMAAEWAKDREVPVIAEPADWDRYGRRAGPVRNEKMLREHRPTHVLAFPGGAGTAHMVRIARAAGVLVRQYHD